MCTQKKLIFLSISSVIANSCLLFVLHWFSSVACDERYLSSPVGWQQMLLIWRRLHFLFFPEALTFTRITFWIACCCFIQCSCVMHLLRLYVQNVRDTCIPLCRIRVYGMNVSGSGRLVGLGLGYSLLQTMVLHCCPTEPWEQLSGPALSWHMFHVEHGESLWFWVWLRDMFVAGLWGALCELVLCPVPSQIIVMDYRKWVFFTSLVLSRGHEFWVDLNAMKLYETVEFDQMRRLSTPSCPSSSSNYYTVWKYFCRDHFVWREYSEVFNIFQSPALG